MWRGGGTLLGVFGSPLGPPYGSNHRRAWRSCSLTGLRYTSVIMTYGHRPNAPISHLWCNRGARCFINFHPSSIRRCFSFPAGPSSALGSRSLWLPSVTNRWGTHRPRYRYHPAPGPGQVPSAPTY